MPSVLLSGANNKSDNQNMPVIPFTRASMEHVEPGGVDVTVSDTDFAAGPKQLGPYDVTAFGYLRSIKLLVEATGGAGTAGVAEADAPWSVIKSIALHDVNGQYLVGPISGYDLFLINKWGGYGFDDDPTNNPSYSAVAATGNFAFMLSIPTEIVGRDALGALPNMNSASTFKLSITLADDADVFSTPPTTMPDVRLRAWVDCWTRPGESDPFGNPQQTAPPNVGATQFWTKSTYAVSAGNQTIKLSRVGNYVRNIIATLRDASADREGANVPDPMELHYDGQPIYREGVAIRRATMSSRYGYALSAVTTAGLDEGVMVYDYTHDFDGKPGGEMRDLWFPTTQASRLEFVGTFGGAGTLEVLTNDVFVPGQGS